MIDHYNAFISYKHEPKDIAIARNVQKSLERYRIPKKLRESTGVNKIDRIFRDTDELPLTSDLSETIYDALDKSDYLIVICSTKTKESQWVNREIEYFISKHSRKNVLTVLVDGEPSEVVPEILTYEEKTIIDEDGNEKVIRKDLEPLSCDYRKSIKEGNKKELPRLVSTLIGCGYDELMNRQKAYKTKKTIISLSIAVALGTLFIFQLFYFIYRINSNYMAVLENKSKYLSNESMSQLKKGQRILAIQLALNALPNDKNKAMPVTPEAERAIIDATGVYDTDDNTIFYNDFSYQMPNMIIKLAVNESETRIAAVDISGAISLWNVETHEQIFLKKSAEYQYEQTCSFANDNILIISDGMNISGYDASTGELKWKKEYYSFLLLEKNDFSDSIELVDFDNNYYKLDANTGEELSTQKLKLDEPLINLPFSHKVSPDGNSILVIYEDGDKNEINILNVSNNKITNICETNEFLNEVFWYDNNNLLLTTEENIEDRYIDFSNGYDDFTLESNSNLYCYDVSSGKEKWCKKLTHYISDLYCGIKPDYDNNIVYFYLSELLYGFDINSGKEINKFNINDSIMTINVSSEDNRLDCITNKGLYGKNSDSLNDTSDVLFINDLFPEEIRYAYLSDDRAFIFTADSNEILTYVNKVPETDFTKLDEFKEDDIGVNDYVNDHYLFLVRTKEKSASLEIFDTNNVQKYSYDITDIKDSIIDVLGSDNKYVYLYVNDFENTYIRKLSIQTGDSQDIKIDSDVAADYCSLDNNSLVYCYEEDNHVKIKCLDLNKENATPLVYDLNEESSITDSSLSYSLKEHIIYYAGDKDYIIDTETNEIKNVDLPSDWQGTDNISNILNENILISDKSTALLIDKNGDVKFNTVKQGYDVVGLYLYTDKKNNDKIVVVYPKILSRFNIETGENEENTNLGFAFYDNPEKFKLEDKDTLVICSEGKYLSIIDANEWYEKSLLNYALDLQGDKLIAYRTTSDVSIGYFKYLSIDELIEKGNELLQGKELTEDQKSYYGIED